MKLLQLAKPVSGRGIWHYSEAGPGKASLFLSVRYLGLEKLSTVDQLRTTTLYLNKSKLLSWKVFIAMLIT